MSGKTRKMTMTMTSAQALRKGICGVLPTTDAAPMCEWLLSPKLASPLALELGQQDSETVY